MKLAQEFVGLGSIQGWLKVYHGLSRVGVGVI